LRRGLGPSFLEDTPLKKAVEAEQVLKAAGESEQLPKVVLVPEQPLTVAECWGQHHSEIARSARSAGCSHVRGQEFWQAVSLPQCAG
ncbi:MAG: hypothetical protein WB624_22850, partial [Xanthobacteraceae bacterium]